MDPATKTILKAKLLAAAQQAFYKDHSWTSHEVTDIETFEFLNENHRDATSEPGHTAVFFLLLVREALADTD